MDLAFTPEEQKFADEVRAFVKANLPADVRDKVKNGKHLIRDDYMRWQQALGKQGWLVYTWPKKHGGPGFTPAAALHLREHLRRGIRAGHHPVRHQDGRAGDLHLRQRRAEGEVPAGDPQEHRVVVPGLLRAGLGLRPRVLRTKAEKQGDHYIVNGSKTWNTMGHWADWIFCLVRTDPKAKPQEGISFLLIDMKTPGITVKPIIMMDGGHEVNEVFFDNVKVPVANLVGKENEGWTCAKFLLANERLGIAAVPQSKRGVEALKDIARAEQDNGKPLIENQSFAEKIADLEIQVTALEYTELRVLSQMAHGGQPGPEVSGLKIRGSEIQQRITELTMEAVGEYSAPYLPGLLWQGTQRGAGRAGLRPPRRAALLQQPQDHDLRRQQRDPEGHHLARWCWGCDHPPTDLLRASRGWRRGPRSGHGPDLKPSTSLRRRSPRLRAREPLARDQGEDLLRQALRPRRPCRLAAGARQARAGSPTPGRRSTAARAGTSRSASCSRTCWPRRARRASSRSA